MLLCFTCGLQSFLLLVAHFEGLQDKLAQLKDAREALTSLRQEHEEKRRIEAEERAKRKQIQMMQKLDVLRKQKQVLV